jgi:hypothetical protein
MDAGKVFLKDLFERVGSTFLVALIAVVTANVTDLVHVDWRAQLVLIGGPAVLSLLKGLLAKLSGDPNSASLNPSQGAVNYLNFRQPRDLTPPD